MGLDIDSPGAAPEQLAALLSDARVAVRQRVQQTLVQRGDRSVNALTAVLRRQANALRSKVPNEGGVTRADDHAAAARHAIWALSAIGSDQARESLREILNAEDPELTALAASMVTRESNVAGSAIRAPGNRPVARKRVAYPTGESPPVQRFDMHGFG